MSKRQVVCYLNRCGLPPRENKGVVKTEAGSFVLGITEFTLPQQQLNSDDPAAELVGEAAVGTYAVRALIRQEPNKVWPPMQVSLESEPELKPKDLLSLVFFGKKHTELSAEQAARVDALNAP